MGKKNKKADKKGKGEEKTKQKADKKAVKRTKKELEGKGEDDIEKLIAEFREQDKKKVQVIEEKCGPPPPRCNGSLVAHPERDELIMFGGEYFTGNKMYVYNEIYIYNIRKQEWTKVSVPNSPPPRSAHQSVVVSQQGGQMWIFGGEFSSHSQAQFYHYKDLWVLHLRDRSWEQVKAPGGPSARSGHRMIALKKQLIVFGGFHDNTRDYKYFNDVFSFNLETYTWSSLNPSGQGPCPRSACVFLPISDSGRAVVYGGYSKERQKKDVDKGLTHTDMFVLALEKKREGVAEGEQRWKWQSCKQSGFKPTPRSGMTGVVGPNNRAYLFGGVFDEEDEDEFLEGVFYNEMWMLEMEKLKWFPIELKDLKQSVGDKKKRRRKKKTENGEEEETEDAMGDDDDDEEGEDEDMEVTQQAVESLNIDKPAEQEDHNSVFKVSIAAPSAASTSSSATDMDTGDLGSSEVEAFWPSKRMNPALTVKSGQLYMYGGIFEDDKDRQVTLSDMYSMDTHGPSPWKILVANDPKLQEWEDSDSEDEGGKSGGKAGAAAKMAVSDDDSDESMDDDDEDDICFDDAPARREGEGIGDYFERSKSYWMTKAREIYEEDGDKLNDRRLLRFAKEVCEEACG